VYPARQFGTSRTYGLIAQEVERVLPDLVVTGDDGYKAVDYSQLPLLAVQAIGELKQENDTLKARLAAIERLLQGSMNAAKPEG
jgi:predicted methyltransferase